MARMEEWQREAQEAVRREGWSLTGPNQVVKVVASDAKVFAMLAGYITLGKYLVNKTPSDIETDLGLRAGELPWELRFTASYACPSHPNMNTI